MTDKLLAQQYFYLSCLSCLYILYLPIYLSTQVGIHTNPPSGDKCNAGPLAGCRRVDYRTTSSQASVPGLYCKDYLMSIAMISQPVGNVRGQDFP